jgi:hypothetical protein
MKLLKVVGSIIILCAMSFGFKALAETHRASPWDVSAVRSGLIEAGTAYAITENCPRASVRMIRGFMFLYDINQMAKEAGFSRSEVDDFIENKENKANLEAIVWDRLASQGATEFDEASVCDAAMSEVSMGSAASSLFSMKN